MSEDFVRYSDGKRQWQLMDWDALESTVRVLEYGATKYPADNYTKITDPQTQLIPSILRHAISLSKGEIFDNESGLPHAAHLITNCMFAENFRLRNQNETQA
jgi:hypothetical protein